MASLKLDSEIFTRGVEDIITPKELQALLKSKKKLRIKLGLDATSPDIHIGHAVNLWKIRKLQEAGHKAVIILGDLTTAIGDPTGRSKTRPVLKPEEIKKNIENLKKNIKKILIDNTDVLEIRKNSEWFGKMTAPEFLKIVSKVTHARLIEREMFQKRIREGNEIFMHELLYPIIQGFDSYVINADLTIIGSDQLFNEHMGRFFQERFGKKPQVIITNKILPGLGGGEKMSKSLGNYISLNDTPEDKFGKSMTLRDDLIIPYLEMYTDVPLAELSRLEGRLKKGLNPMEAKIFWAESLVKRYHGKISGEVEKNKFLKKFSKKESPQDAPEFVIPAKTKTIIEILLIGKIVNSKTEARRLVVQGAVDVGGEKIKDPNYQVSAPGPFIVRIGKHRFLKIILK